MKNICLFLIFLTFISCQKQDFRGFGGFDIDTDFASNKKSKEFKKTMPDEFYCNVYKLSNEIGEVSDLNVTTDNGKIIEVKFSTNANTNITEIQKQFKALNEKGKSFKTEIGTFKTYATEKEDIVFMDVEYKNEKMKNGQPKHDFRYSNRKAIENNEKQIKAMASNGTLTKNKQK